jgi:ribosomal protein S6--L-glutamate ligase
VKIGLLAPIPPYVDPTAPYPLAEAFEATGATVEVLDPNALEVEVTASGLVRVESDGETVDELDAVVLRTRGVLHLDVAAAFEAQGIECFNGIEPTRIAADKWSTHLRLARSGLPSVDTVLPKSWEQVFGMLERWPDGLLLKPRLGSQGQGIVVLRTRDDADRESATLTDGLPTYVAQRLIPLDPVVDYRAFVVGDRVSAWMRREAPDGSVLANLSAGGAGTAVEPPPVWSDVALAATRSVDLNIAGVDLLEEQGRPVVLEVNPTPGFRGIEAHTEADVCSAIASFVTRRVASRFG